MFRRIINSTKSQINNNTVTNQQLTNTTNTHTTNLAVNDRVHVSGRNYSNNYPDAGNKIDNLYRAVADGVKPPAIPNGRTITFVNNTASTDLDLYLTVGGSNPQPIALLAGSIPHSGGMHVWDIPDDIYGWNGNFTTMPAGTPPPKYNAGPTIVEFGLNQYWHGATPPLRDTFDISTVPPGIGTQVNDGPRSKAVQISQAAGFSVQQSYNYNVGVQIVPPPPADGLMTETVTCVESNGDCAESIGFPNDTAYPKQQTGVAAGNYTVNFMDPVVSL